MAEGPGDPERVGRLAVAFATAREPRDVHLALHRFIREATSANSLFIASYDREREMRRCEFAFSDGVEQDVSQLPAIGLNGNHSSEAIRTGRTVVVRDLRTQLESLRHVDMGLDIDPRLPCVAIAVPMIAHESTLGYLEIQSCEPGAFGERDIVMVETAARLAALALENLALQARERARLASVEERLESQAVARGLVRRMLSSLAQRSHLPAQSLRELGRELGRGVQAKDGREFADAYGLMGLGELSGETKLAASYRFRGHDLLEHLPEADGPTCYLTLGFLEGGVESLTGQRALGTELECQSLGHEACVFVVAPRGPDLTVRR